MFDHQGVDNVVVYKLIKDAKLLQEKGLFDHVSMLQKLMMGVRLHDRQVVCKKMHAEFLLEEADGEAVEKTNLIITDSAKSNMRMIKGIYKVFKNIHRSFIVPVALFSQEDA